MSGATELNRTTWQTLASLGTEPLVGIVKDLARAHRFAELQLALETDIPDRPGTGDLLAAMAITANTLQPSGHAALTPIVAAWSARVVASWRADDLMLAGRQCLDEGGPLPLSVVQTLVAGGLDWQTLLLGERGVRWAKALQSGSGDRDLLPKLRALLPDPLPCLPRIQIAYPDRRRDLHDLVKDNVQGTGWLLDLQTMLVARSTELRETWARQLEQDALRTRRPTSLVSWIMAGVPVSEVARDALANSAWSHPDGGLHTFPGVCLRYLSEGDNVQVLPVLAKVGIPLTTGTPEADWNTPLWSAVHSNRPQTASLLLDLGADACRERPITIPGRSTPLQVAEQRMAAAPDWIPVVDKMRALAARAAVTQTLQSAALLP